MRGETASITATSPIPLRTGDLPSRKYAALDRETCHVWRLRASDASPGMLPLLNLEERQRLLALRRQGDRNRFLAGCGLTRLVLSEYLNEPPSRIALLRTCPACGGPHGKPHLKPSSPPIEFSVSHAGEVVLAAFAWCSPIGVDVENVRFDMQVDELMPQTLTAREISELDASCSHRCVVCFLTYWTRKEAILKATGDGLAMPMAAFSVTPPHQTPSITSWARSPERVGRFWLSDLHPGASYLGSLAVIGESRMVVERDGSDLLASYFGEPAQG
jgi:4'-phosphopantetheinyl transferase